MQGCSKPALISKGLRPRAAQTARAGLGSKPALISKGLRRGQKNMQSPSPSFQTCPDFKGIKTQTARAGLGGVVSSKPALISKGLRLGTGSTNRPRRVVPNLP